MDEAAPDFTDLPPDQLADPAFWRARFPELTLGGEPTDFEALAPSNEAMVRAQTRMAAEGYFGGSDEGLADLARPMAEAVERLHRMGAPPVFLFLFDEAWAAFNRQTRMIAAILGPGYQVLPDFWVWRVDPGRGDAGWRPHRDRGYRSLGPDRSPLSLTVWIPLNAAVPDSSCMYILPADKDPTYGQVNDGQYQIDLPAIRALPAQPGDWLCWNQAVLHWGGQTSRFADHPRISMALEFQKGGMAAMNQPLLGSLPNPDFAFRLRLICKQILQYAHMYPLPPELAAAAKALLAKA